MRRNRAAIACGLAFFLCLLICVLWVRSLKLADYVTFTTGDRFRDLYSELGSLQYARSELTGADNAGWSYEGIRDPFAHYRGEVPGGFWGQWSWERGDGRFHWSIPFWPLGLLATFPAGFWVYRHGVPAAARLLLPAAAALWPVELAILAPTLGWEVERDGGILALALCLWATAVAVPVLLVRDRAVHWMRHREKPWPWQFRATVRYRRRLRGLCMECGYDVRASGRVCPECGTPIAGRAGEVISYGEQAGMQG
jgi:hypothetical protein